MAEYFEKHGYSVIPNVLSPQVCELIYIQCKMIEEIKCYEKSVKTSEILLGDPQVEKSFSYYAPLCCESLCVYLKPVIEKHINKELLPTYSYMRIYYKGAHLKKHTDREECEISASVCINMNSVKPWEFCLTDKTGKNVSISLNSGDLVVYSRYLEHWRDEYTGTEQTQTFLHYVDKNGPYTNRVLDSRKLMGLPK
jgi:hypothetical protein